VPAHTVTLFRGILSMRVPRFPLLYIGLVTLLVMTPMLTAVSFFLAVYGLLTSWTYLRFYKAVFPDLDASNQPASLRGDASETFAFAEFFPGPVRPFVAGVSDSVFNVLVAMKVCTPFSQADVHNSAAAHRGESSFGGGGHRGGGNHRAEAERRRALALKALDQRLHAATAGRAAAAPAAPAPAATGPTVQTQPQASTQKAMTAPSAAGEGAMLGQTSYNPDVDDK